MSRSVKVRKDCIQKVKSAVKRYGYARQKDLADDLGCSLATVSNFLNGKPVDFSYFEEICQKLGQDLQAIADLDYNDSNSKTKTEEPFVCEPEPDFIYVERPPIESLCYETLLQPGALLRIKASGLMGKTSWFFST
ncbi:AAA-like domain-containing protein [Desmonostoc muscorum LEGE 12446]|uniref:AAA-like domain-containing protein n=1 Tax=Desmonostoc muscorum LEGE 12446 TaxID=1828758 RepID=A0A8J6ZSB8_DESMC|nr:AAA-like domain-containing protein [Desmonostoc muscorum]MCF2151540.1 AAA-like domain-containing protein [Desmonostoc muscorum LEGE 12446]